MAEVYASFFNGGLVYDPSWFFRLLYSTCALMDEGTLAVGIQHTASKPLDQKLRQPHRRSSHW